METIGDAYMVSSGVPQVIGDRHAPEISMLAMDILRIDFMLRQLSMKIDNIITKRIRGFQYGPFFIISRFESLRSVSPPGQLIKPSQYIILKSHNLDYPSLR